MSTITGKVSQIIGPVIDVEFNTENLNYLRFTIH